MIKNGHIGQLQVICLQQYGDERQNLLPSTYNLFFCECSGKTFRISPELHKCENSDVVTVWWQINCKMAYALGKLSVIWIYKQNRTIWQPAEFSPLLQRDVAQKSCTHWHRLTQTVTSWQSFSIYKLDNYSLTFSHWSETSRGQFEMAMTGCLSPGKLCNCLAIKYGCTEQRAKSTEENFEMLLKPYDK